MQSTVTPTLTRPRVSSGDDAARGFLDDQDCDHCVYQDDNPHTHTHRMFAQKLGERFHKGRFLYINAWRNISDTPIGIHKDIIKIKYNDHIDHDPMNYKHLCELIIINDDNPIMMIIVGLGR